MGVNTDSKQKGKMKPNNWQALTIQFSQIVIPKMKYFNLLSFHPSNCVAPITNSYFFPDLPLLLMFSQSVLSMFNYMGMELYFLRINDFIHCINVLVITNYKIKACFLFYCKGLSKYAHTFVCNTCKHQNCYTLYFKYFPSSSVPVLCLISFYAIYF